MKAFLLPKSILTNIDRKMRNFFWGHNQDRRKLHTINWEKICAPKAKGGLGIIKSEHQNKVHFLYLIWRLNHSPNQPWTKVFINKYGKTS